MLFGRSEISLRDLMPCGSCPKHGCFKIVRGLGLVARRSCKGIHASASSGERGKKYYQRKHG
jgi:hypothetical protein